MVIATILFYVFALLTVFSAVMVISAKNPVHSVLFLIFAFFNASGLFLLMGAELIAMLLVIVYVGAVAVLFLFVVMMLDINFAKLREGFLRYLPLGALIAVILFAEIFLMLNGSMLSIETSKAALPRQVPMTEGVTNAHQIGAVLYTRFAYPFQVAGLVLLVAMVGAIVLTLRQREGVRRQNISRQIARNPRESLRMVKSTSAIVEEENES
jgi:NADH-quinone oxidoreductase subunit J